MGSFTISLDFELGWGAIESNLWAWRQGKGVYRDLRPVMRKFVDHLDSLEISLTWATVGAMISDPQPDDFVHLPEAARAGILTFLQEADAPTRDGRDLFDVVAGAKVVQDIGSHTFSHMRWGLPGFDRSSKLQEMTQACRSLSGYGIDPKSFVYPLNQVADLDVLSETGFAIARTAPRRPASRFGKMTEMLAGRSPGSRLARRADGLVTETGSLLYVWGVRRDWPVRRHLIRQQVRRALRRIAGSDQQFHIWLHPFNLAETPHLLEDSLALLTKAARLRDAGKIEITSMQEKARLL